MNTLSAKERKQREAARRYIARMRQMNPDPVLSARLDEMEAKLNVPDTNLSTV
ncbi:hypothetical protein [Rhodococcus erythropolis]